MKTQKLIPLLDYVLEQKQSVSSDEKKFINQELLSIERIRNYAKFLSQPLKLSQFVPCDENELPLEEPHNLGLIDNYPTGNLLMDKSLEKAIEYNKAKSNVLFEGFELGDIEHDKISYSVITNNENYVFVNEKNKWLRVNDYKTIEDLVHMKLTLTENAVKTING